MTYVTAISTHYGILPAWQLILLPSAPADEVFIWHSRSMMISTYKSASYLWSQNISVVFLKRPSQSRPNCCLGAIQVLSNACFLEI